MYSVASSLETRSTNEYSPVANHHSVCVETGAVELYSTIPKGVSGIVSDLIIAF